MPQTTSFYGQMDYFLSLPTDKRGGGLQDFFIGATYLPDDNIEMKLNLDVASFSNG